ncbi:MAG: carboxy terminal-processing peptidase, partial [Endozoicomonadaceae bacterium]|nr:carboxy terminal-processing peptidase [Endozoicomonadaceae bacterium]
DKIKLEEQEAKYDIVSPSIQGKSYKIGVIRIPTFYLDFKALQEKKDNVKSTTKDVEKIIVKLKKEAVDGIIIDIRNNAGGSLQEAIQLTGLFIPNGPAVAVKSLDRVIYHYQNSQSQHLYLGPMLVMVNGLSASASEIFSAAIQDYRRGLIVGQNTYGKGTVQILNPLREGQLKFTIAKFYRVSGESTQCRGVFPDIEFPDLYHQEAIGEKTLPHALPYDTISPITLNYTDDLTQDSLQYLKFQFENNQHNQPYFDYIRAMNTLNHTFFFKKTVSLSFMARQKELQQFRIKHLKIENDYRVKTGKSIFKSYEALEKYIEYRSEKKSKYQIEEDEYVKKSVFLLSHLVHFKHNNIEKTSQN